jgi:hypothetical protein
MRIVRLRERRALWGWYSGAFGYRAFCLGWWGIGK